MNARHKQFVTEYFKCNMNAARAYMNVYGTNNIDTAYVNSSKLLSNAKIKSEIDRRLERMAMPANEVLARLGEQAAAEYTDYLQPNGTVDLDSLLADGKGHLIKGFKHTKHGLNVEFYAADKALQNVAKAHGIFTDKIEIKVEGELEKLLDQLESNLDTETYDRILSIIQGSQS